MERLKNKPKFKGLVNGKEWGSGSLKLYDNGLAVICGDNRQFYVFKDSVSRFTGYVNSFGKEIYEGDLLALEIFKRKEIHPVFWDEGSHQWKVGSSPLEDPFMSLYLKDCLNNLIVGHIYTHQHLLSSSKQEFKPKKGNQLVKH